MGVLVQALRFVNLFTAAIIAGSQVLVSMVMLPAMRSWPPSMSLKTHQGMLDTQPDRFMVPAAIVCPLSAIGVLLLGRKLKSRSGLWYLIGIVATGVVTVASVGFAEPTSVKMRDWSSDAVPAEYFATRERWDRIHSVRTVAALAALVAYIMAALSE